MLDPIDFRAVRQLVPILTALGWIGWEPTTRTKLCAHGPCPVHRSTTRRSRSLSIKGDLWKCHSCGAAGDVVRLWGLLHHLGDCAAARDLCVRAHVPIPRLVRSRK